MKRMRLLLMVNPCSGRSTGRELAQQALAAFSSRNWQCDLQLTEYAGHATALGNELDLSVYDGICVVGGDGTVHELVNGLQQRDDGISVPLGLVAAGTGNSLHRQLGVEDPRQGIEKILAGHCRTVDLIEVHRDDICTCCLNLAGWLAAANIANRAENLRLLGRARYSWSAFIEIFLARQQSVTITLPDRQIRDELFLVMGCNTQYVGSGMKMAPAARIDDGKLDLVLVRHASRLQMLKMLSRVHSGSHARLPSVEMHQVAEFSIRFPHPVAINQDGNISPETSREFEVKVVPRALRVFA